MFPKFAFFAAVGAVVITSGPLQADDLPTSVTVGQYVAAPNNQGDTWAPAWAKDDRVFSPSNDGSGFGTSPGTNIHFNEITGTDPKALNGVSVNPMLEYGNGGTVTGPEKRTWKSSGCIAVDGALYWTIARHNYASRQDAKDASIIKSTDDGKTWTRPMQDNLDHPMFPGPRFATPYFIQYGQDGHEAVADGSDHYVYALSNNGFWDNGDSLILGRVLRSRIGNLDSKDWQFYTGGDGQDSSWGADPNKAALVLDKPDKVGETGAVYLPKQKCYLMVNWYYPAGGGRVTPDASHTTQWDFYAAQHPWGPWKMIGSHTFHPEAFYCVQVCPKFTSADGNTVWAFTAGDFQNGPQGLYRLVGVPLTIK